MKNKEIVYSKSKKFNQIVPGKRFFALVKGHFCLTKGHLGNIDRQA